MGFWGNRSNTNSWLNEVVHTHEGVVTVGSPDYLHRSGRAQPGQARPEVIGIYHKLGACLWCQHSRLANGGGTSPIVLHLPRANPTTFEFTTTTSAMSYAGTFYKVEDFFCFQNALSTFRL
jgi:hypothetical protein